MPDFLGTMLVAIKGDNTDLKVKVTDASEALKKFSADAKQIGGALTKTLTLPILGAAAASVKFAIDAEETGSKFDTAFKGIEITAESTSKKLQKEFGLSNLEAQKLLSSTGDLLKGFGATASTALSLSEKVQQVSVDLASYNNVQGGAARASEIVTKAMLGERDALTTLGIKISDNDVKAELLARGQEKLTGRALLLAKAQATLGLIYQQSGDAVGDFARTQDSAANQIKQLRSDAIDLASAFGKELLPIFIDVVKNIREGIQYFSSLDTQGKKTVLTFLAIVAGIGPLLSAVGSLSTSFALLTGPVGIVTAGFIGVSLAIAAITLEARKLEKAELKEQFGDLAETAKLTINEFKTIEGILSTLEEQKLFEDTAKSTLNIIKDMSKDLKVNEDIIIDIGLKSSIVNEETKKELAFIKANNVVRNKQLAQLENIQVFNGQHITAQEILAVKQEELNRLKDDELARQAAIAKIEADRIAGVIQGRVTAEQALQNEINKTNILQRLGLLDTVEANKSLISANEKLIEQLIDVSYDGLTGSLGDQAIRKAREEILKLTKENENLTRSIESASSKQVSLTDEYTKRITANYLEYSGTLLSTNDITIEAISFLQSKATEEQKKAEKEALELFQENIIKRLDIIKNFANSFKTIGDEILNNEKINLENTEYLLQESLYNKIEGKRKEVDEFENLEKAKIEQSLSSEDEKNEALVDLEKVLKEKRKVISEEEKAEELKLQKELDKEKRKLKRQEAEANKIKALFDIGLSTLVASIEALPNIPLSISVGALGLGAEIAVAARPLPALAKGGIFEGPAVVGEAGLEAAIPLEGARGKATIDLFSASLLKAMGKMVNTNTTNNSSNNVNNTFINNSMFGDQNRESLQRFATAYYPFHVAEEKRIGVR